MVVLCNVFKINETGYGHATPLPFMALGNSCATIKLTLHPPKQKLTTCN